MRSLFANTVERGVGGGAAFESVKCSSSVASVRSTAVGMIDYNLLLSFLPVSLGWNPISFFAAQVVGGGLS